MMTGKKIPLTIVAVLAVCLAMGGITCMAAADNFSSASAAGLLLSVASAVFAASYKVRRRRRRRVCHAFTLDVK